MSINLDRAIAETGTKFKIFPQPRFLPSFAEPETVRVSIAPANIKPGPADDRMYVLDAINKVPYSDGYQRPYSGPSNPPVQPGPDGHFDHLDVDSREFSCATMYATVRRVLDIWEDYFGRRIEWHFKGYFDDNRLELIPLIVWDNAQSGWGFLEFGYARRPFVGGVDLTKPYCQNFDVLAHELGHSIVFAEVGWTNNVTPEYWGFHESIGDLVSIVALLHFNKVVDLFLETSKGNLFTANELSRFGELSESHEIRRAFNYERMSTVSQEEHDLSKPLTGAIFDVFVEVFQKELVQAGLISQELADLSFHGPDVNVDDNAIQAKFEQAYTGKHEQFKEAMLKARDYLGIVLANIFAKLSAGNLTYDKVGLELMRVDLSISGGQHQMTIRECFLWREINTYDPLASLMRTVDTWLR